MKRCCQLVLLWMLLSCALVPQAVGANTKKLYTKDYYESKGLLPYKGDPYFRLGKLDQLGRPTWAHIQFHDFIEAKAAKGYKNPKVPINGKTGYMTDYLPGFQGNEDYYLIPSELKQGAMQKVWEPRHLLSILWTDSLSANVARNYGLITTYANQGFPIDSRIGLVTLRDYEQALDDWPSSSSSDWDSKTGYNHYMVDYKIELIYHGQELVPRQIKLRYIGLTEQGKLKKMDLPGPESFDQYGIATVVIDNIAPNVTIDYLTGAVTGQVYVPQEDSDRRITDDPYNEEDELEVFVDMDSGYYYYDVSNPDDYWVMTEKEALEDGYVWDALE